jgi:spore coat protein H
MSGSIKRGVVVPLLLAALGCDDAGPSGPAPTNQGTAGQSNAGGAGPCGAQDLTLQSQDAADLFAFPHVPSFDLYLPAAAWVDLQVHARDEQYAEAQACFEGKGIGRVGLRFKGSYGSLYNCFDASGKNTCRKLGMKIDFDQYDSELRFYRLKKLNFQSYHYDDSYLKERLSYDLYRAMDIVAPRAAWALLRVNGDPQGLFGMVEDVDGRFTDNRWPDHGDGNLYKEAWPGQTDDAWLLAHLHTNEELGQIAAFKAFSGAINAASEAELRPTLGSYMDLDYLARYMAVDDGVANFDGLTTFYTSGDPNWAGNHNYYIYEEAADHYTLIPWDLEATLYPSGFGNVPSWQTVPADCALTYPVWGDGKNRVIAPGCDRTIRAMAADLESYHAASRRLLDGPFAEATMLAAIDQHAAFIRAEATVDPHGPGASQFESAVSFLRQEIPQLRRRLEFIQTGQSTIPLEITVGQTMDFEANDDYGLTVGTMQMSNGHTTASVALDQTDPIDGAKSLRILFDFGNETTAWQQWTLYRVPLVAAPKDLSALTGIRLKARSNQARTLRFDLISPKDTADSKGIHFGWDLALAVDPKSFEVFFANAAIPSWAADPGDKLSDIQAAVSNLSFQPICNGRDSSGQLPAGVTDNGWADIDDIEFF